MRYSTDRSIIYSNKGAARSSVPMEVKLLNDAVYDKAAVFPKWILL